MTDNGSAGWDADEPANPVGEHFASVEQMWAEFGSWIAGERTRLGLTKRQAAERADLSPSTWATLEEGGRNYRGDWLVPSPSDVTLVRVGRALGIDSFDVFRFIGRRWTPAVDPEPPPEPPPPASVAEKVDRLADEVAQLRDELAELMRRWPPSIPQDGRPSQR